MLKKKVFHYTLAIACFFAACHVSQRTLESTPVMQQVFDIQGHRGCRGLMPENTVPAMRRALDLGVTTLEMDVVITKDRNVVLSHDPFMHHDISTQPDGSEVTVANEKSFNIFQMTYAEVSAFDVGKKAHPRFPRQEKMVARKPLLADMFDSIRQYMTTAKRPLPFFNIETKCTPAGDNVFHPGPEEFVDLLVAEIKKANVAERVIIQSFDFRTLRYLHKKYPGIHTAMLIEENDKRSFAGQVADLGFLPNIYSPAHSLVTEELVKTCHEQGVKVIPWTVNDKTRITVLRQMGVDGIISDYPDLFN